MACLEEMQAAFAHVEQPSNFIVEAAEECIYAELIDWQLERIGVTIGREHRLTQQTQRAHRGLQLVRHIGHEISSNSIQSLGLSHVLRHH